MEERESGVELAEILKCYTCERLGSKGDMKFCCRCDFACYCDKACQLDHWEEHKKSCSQIKAQRKLNKGNREFRLFSQWINKATQTVSVYCYYRYEVRDSGVELVKKREIDPMKEAFRFEVGFDFNFYNFKPTSPVETVALESLDERQLVLAKSISNLKDSAVSGKSPSPAAFIRYKSFELAVPLTRSSKMNAHIKYTKNEGEGLCDEYMHSSFSGGSLRLSSSIFDEWDKAYDMRRKNLITSLCPVIQDSILIEFLLNALHLTSKRPRHMSHALLVAYSFGLGMGQAKSLDYFAVKSIPEAYLCMDEAVSGPNSEKGQFPQLQIATTEEQCDGQIHYRIPIVFLVSAATCRSYPFCLVLFHEVPKNLVTKKWPSHKTRKCDQAALAAFGKLQKINFLQSNLLPSILTCLIELDANLVVSCHGMSCSPTHFLSMN